MRGSDQERSRGTDSGTDAMTRRATLILAILATLGWVWVDCEYAGHGCSFHIARKENQHDKD